MATVTGRWSAIVGDVAASHCEPEGFDSGALLIRADSSAWATQLTLLTPQILASIAEVAGDGVVDRLIVRGPAARKARRGWRVQ